MSADVNAWRRQMKASTPKRGAGEHRGEATLSRYDRLTASDIWPDYHPTPLPIELWR